MATQIVQAPKSADEAGTAPLPLAAVAAQAESGQMTDLDADSLAHAEELMAGARATLSAAGRLDLIEVAS